MASKHQLAMESIHIEQDMIRETVGSQDQVSAAYGGLNQIVFSPGGEITVKPVTISYERLEKLGSHVMLFYTGIKRTASDVAKSYVADIEDKADLLEAMDGMVDEALEDPLRQRLSLQVRGTAARGLVAQTGPEFPGFQPRVGRILCQARAHGAIGGKIMGAGGGGFLMLFVPPEAQEQVRLALKELLHVPVQFESSGDPDYFLRTEQGGFCGAGSAKNHNLHQAFPGVPVVLSFLGFWLVCGLFRLVSAAPRPPQARQPTAEILDRRGVIFPG